MSINYNQRLTQAEEKLRQAEAAKRRKDEANNAEQRAIYDAQSEIHQIRYAEEQERIAGIVKQNAELVMEGTLLYDRMINAAGRHEIREAIALYAEADSLWLKHSFALDAALGALNVSVYPGSRLRAAIKSRVPLLYGVDYALIYWISQASDPIERRIRQGIMHAITGKGVWEPIVSFDPLAAYIRDHSGM